MIYKIIHINLLIVFLVIKIFFINMHESLSVNEVDFSDLFAEDKWEYVMLNDNTFNDTVKTTEYDEYKNGEVEEFNLN